MSQFILCHFCGASAHESVGYVRHKPGCIHATMYPPASITPDQQIDRPIQETPCLRCKELEQRIDRLSDELTWLRMSRKDA